MPYQLSGRQTSGSVTYASGVTPWVAPSTGYFTVNLAAARGAGRGSFTKTGISKTGTARRPDIGPAQYANASEVPIIGG